MAKQIRILIAQCNATVGDVAGNAETILRTIDQVQKDQAADLIVFPECMLCGYPPEDLLFQQGFQESTQAAIETIRQHTQGVAVIFGHPIWTERDCFNAASIIYDGSVLSTYHKQSLPNHGVFDERRYFSPGKIPGVVSLFGCRFGVLICEDTWTPKPALLAKQAGAEVLIGLHASPFYPNRIHDRYVSIQKRALETQLPIVNSYMVGGQDELVFDGASFVVDAEGSIRSQLPMFSVTEQSIVLEKQAGNHWRPIGDRVPELEILREAQLYQALTLATKDYVHKSGFKKVLVGLSGGIDSALVLTIAADALGPKNVEAVLLPSQYTTEMSNTDAIGLANALGVSYRTLPIESTFNQVEATLAPSFTGMQQDVTEENIQARIRGLLLMALSNKFGALLLTTSNKSEAAVGYATLYGDMAGAYAVIKDIYKTDVYRLAKYRNSLKPVIPERIITRPPSAELRPDQKDQDSLPDYDTLDAVLVRIIEHNVSLKTLIAEGYDQMLCERVFALLKNSEYKRAQAAPGPKVSKRSFGKDWRMPIINGHKEGA